MARFNYLSVLNMGIVYLVWGSTFFAMEVGLNEGWPPFLLSGLRFVTAGVLLYGFARWRGETAADGTEWLTAAKLGFLIVVCGPGLVGWSEQWINSGMAALLAATSPFWVSILDRDERFTFSKATALGLGFVGLVWLLGASLSLSEVGVLLGAVACLLSGVAWAVGSLSARHNPQQRTPFHRSGTQLMLAGLVMSLGGFATGEKIDLSQLSGNAWAAQLYLIVFGSVVGYSAYIWSVNNLSAGVVATHAYVNPLVAIVLVGVLGHATLPVQAFPAGALILLSVVLLQYGNRKPKKPLENLDDWRTEEPRRLRATA